MSESVKICAISDLHGNLPVVPECDICVIAGDICPVTNHCIAFQARWLDTVFRAWLEQVPAKHIVGIAGNHDIVFDAIPALVPQDLPWRYLFNETVELEGIAIHGTPYHKRFSQWPFMYDEDELERLWRNMPRCDVLVTHGPPFGAGDFVPSAGHQGSVTLANKLAGLNIPLCIVGHIHEGYGLHTLGNTLVVNASVLNERYRMVNPPTMLEATSITADDIAAAERMQDFGITLEGLLESAELDRENTTHGSD